MTSLHSIMFLFQWSWQLQYQMSCMLYIPLCFYFNLRTFSRILAAPFSLHSIMFLFQLSEDDVNVILDIPLHSIMFLFQSVTSSLILVIHLLYIPLCFYFNQSDSRKILKRYLYFTFHYVSISIFLTASCIARSVSFTFHYVSISINCASNHFIGDVLLYIPLCFYFNRIFLSLPRTGYRLYIPLCFYFNAKMTVNPNPCPSFFTFHYVSISINSSFYLISISDTSLHSIMFLFQSVPCFPALHRSYFITFCRPRLLLVSGFAFSVLSLCAVGLFALFFLCFQDFVDPMGFGAYRRSTVRAGSLLHRRICPKTLSPATFPVCF